MKWIQRLADRRPGSFEDALRQAGALPDGSKFRWLSPLRADEWAEYRDGAFLDRLGLTGLRGDLDSFWPRGGPQWDGLRHDTDGSIYLVEAKAHLAELASTCQATWPDSRALISGPISLGSYLLRSPRIPDFGGRHVLITALLLRGSLLHRVLPIPGDPAAAQSAARDS